MRTECYCSILYAEINYEQLKRHVDKAKIKLCIIYGNCLNRFESGL